LAEDADAVVADLELDPPASSDGLCGLRSRGELIDRSPP
jgi:hypothetical protein